MISITETSEPDPAADFIFNKEKITVNLKTEIREQMAAQIQEAIKMNNGLTEGYWQKVRELALTYWLEMDRNEIFVVNKQVRR